jgi:trans-aconitate 2-methyltransferase
LYFVRSATRKSRRKGMMAQEWDAAAYHRLSAPQLEWGLRMLQSVELAGDETALDAGCGTGRVTAALAARLPRGRVLAVDGSLNMARAARENLRSGALVVQADLLGLPLAPAAVDLVFSNATFHCAKCHGSRQPSK